MNTLFHDLWYNWGGHANHEFFWESLSPCNVRGGIEPGPNTDISKLIVSTYGSLKKFTKEFRKQGENINGSGWTWLVYDPSRDELHI